MNTKFGIRVYSGEERLTLPGYTLKILRELKIYRFALINFIVNNLRTRYRRSTLGFLWSLLNPLLMMTVISVVFSVIFQQDLKTFSVFIFSGLAPWWFISGALIGGCQTIINAEGFLKKVYLPKVLFPIITVTTETINFFFTIISLCILSLVLGFRLSWSIFFLPVVIIITYIFNLGLNILVSVSTVYFRDLTQILQVLLQALFYLVPIVYPIEALPERYRVYFLYNPFYYFIILFRKVIYGEPAITVLDWLTTSALAIIVLLSGLLLLMKYDRDLIYRL
jgi:ABC-2 type transport system permease protein/lipopolysaccharide transport system permease protein